MDLTDAYENGKYIPGAAEYPGRWAAAALAFRQGLGPQARLDLPYGPGARNHFDLFVPESTPKGLLVFVHGGYWRKFDKSVWSHLAAGPMARGWAVAMPSYTLAPQARIAEITGEVALTIQAAAQEVAGPLVLSGHSAGGHLSARMRCTGVLSAQSAARVVRIVPISPLSDLRPLMQTDMNSDLRLDAEECASESPALCEDLHDSPTAVWVGSAERPAFLDQARWLSGAWNCALHIAEGLHHFDVIEGMAHAESELTEALVGGL